MLSQIFQFLRFHFSKSIWNVTDLFLELKVYFSNSHFNTFFKSVVRPTPRHSLCVKHEWEMLKPNDPSSLFQCLRFLSVSPQSQKCHQGQKCHILHLVNALFRIWAKFIASLWYNKTWKLMDAKSIFHVCSDTMLGSFQSSHKSYLIAHIVSYW